MRRQQELAFGHRTIDPNPPSERLTFCEPIDLTGDGTLDVIVGGKGAAPHLSVLGVSTRLPNYRRRLRGLLGQPETNLFWYENTDDGWIRHPLAETEQLEVGAALADIDGDGRTDLLAGRTVGYGEVYWFRQPADPRRLWDKHVLTDRFDMYHDLTVADVDGDGNSEVVGLSQEAETLFYYDIPPDPTVEPWPDADCHVIAEAFRAEGLAVVDIDRDGDPEILAGTNVVSRTGEGDGAPEWHVDPVLEGWDPVRIAVADLDGDGAPEVVYAEGDSPAHGTHMARVAWADPEEGWEPHLLRESMYCPHSVATGDLTGDGRPDIYVGEMGLGENPVPKHLLFRNLGNGRFEERLIARGTPTHEAKLADVDGDGRLDIVGKSFKPDMHVDVWYNETDW